MPDKEKDKTIKNPGSKGGKFYINSNGHVVYGEKPKGKNEYDPKKEFKEQFPGFEEFNKIAEDKGFPNITEVDYKKLYQTEHKAYMKAVKDSGTKHVKGFSGEEQLNFFNKHMYLDENGNYAGKTIKQVMAEAQAQGLDISEAEATKFYKKVKYEEKKAKSNPKPKPEPEKLVPEKKPEPEIDFDKINEALKQSYPKFNKALEQMVFDDLKSKEELGLDEQHYILLEGKYNKLRAEYKWMLMFNSYDSKIKLNKAMENTAQQQAEDTKEPVPVKFEYPSTTSLPTQIKFGVGSELGEELNHKKPISNIGKVVYWQHNPSASKWEAGEIVGYDVDKDEYFIKATSQKNGVTFIKQRPSDGIRVPMETKTFYPKPEFDYSKLTDGKQIAMSSNEAKEYFKSMFNSYSKEQLASGIVINHDSGMIENLEVKMRYSKSNNSYLLEMKLRNSDVKKELYDNMKKSGELKPKIWKGQDEFGNPHEFPVSNYSLYKNEGDVTLEYNGVKTLNQNYKGWGTSMTQDSGWTIKDLVTMSVPMGSVKDAGEAYEKSLEALSKHLSQKSMDGLFSKPDAGSIEMARNLNVLNALDPKWVDKQSAFVGKYNEINMNDVESKLKEHLGDDWQSKIKYEETLEGHNSYVIKDYHKELEKNGLKQVITGTGSTGKDGVHLAMLMMETGGLSSLERHKRGIVNHLSSGHQDYHSGGAEYLFTRIVNDSNYAKSYQGYKSSGDSVKIVWKNSVMDRTDMIIYDGDKYGSTLPKGEEAKELIAHDADYLDKAGYKEGRTTAIKQAKNGYLYSENECDFKKGISPKYIERVACYQESEMKLFAEKFKEKGWIGKGHPDGSGKLFSDSVQLMKTNRANSKAQYTLTDYLKSNGYM